LTLLYTAHNILVRAKSRQEKEMKSQNRLLIGFGIGIGVLVIVTIALVLAIGQQKPALLPEGSPEGTVQRYLLAIQNKDFNAAYDFLSPDQSTDFPKTQTRDMWIQSAQGLQDTAWKANLVKVTLTGDTARVEVSIQSFRAGGGLDSSTYSRDVTFSLKKQGQSWLITSPRDIYNLY
jgi:hypothetical protein